MSEKISLDSSEVRFLFGDPYKCSVFIENSEY